MSYRADHDYDDDRDVITCVTLSDTRPVARMQPISRAPGAVDQASLAQRPRENLLSGSLPHGRGQGTRYGAGGQINHEPIFGKPLALRTGGTLVRMSCPRAVCPSRVAPSA